MISVEHTRRTDNNSGNEGATSIGEMLKANTTLTELYLQSMKVDKQRRERLKKF